MTNAKRTVAVWAMTSLVAVAANAQHIGGTVTDKTNHEPLIGATVTIDGTKLATVTDIDGRFAIDGLKPGKAYNITINYLAYKPTTLKNVASAAADAGKDLTIEMQPDQQTLGEVSVTAMARRNTDAAMLQVARKSQVIVSNVSAQEISKTQDSNAGEVIRRVPGVSLIDDKFVMVRGLSQRYNNVWINGGAAPSSEADSRAFSFDLIPSSQIDNMQIVKTPSPEYPADYSGGFVVVNTKDIPATNSADIQIGAVWNDATAFSPFSYNKASSTDFLGFDGGLRSMHGGLGSSLKSIAGDGIDLTGNHFNNDWRVRSKTPLGDLKLSASLGRHWNVGGSKLGMIAAVNYTNEYRKFENMTNNLFSVYDADRDCSNYLRNSTDNQYNHNTRLGAMLNFAYLSANGKHKIQWKNLFNQLGNDRYTYREGVDAQSNNERQAEYYYRSRTTVNTQLTGKHSPTEADEIDWSLSYSFANRNVPDRRRYVLNDGLETGVIQLNIPNDITREWTKLNEHIASVAANAKHDFDFASWKPSLKAGVYGEYRTRQYRTRNFIYNYDISDNTLPANYRSMDITELLSTQDYFGEKGLYLLEEASLRDNYKGNNTLASGYVAATLPVGPLSIYAGLRYEHDRMELVTNTRDDRESPLSHYYTYNDLFPSINSTYKINDNNQLRLSYGRSVNRPEFREVSPSVFYDFDLAADVQGNSELRSCYVQNVDLRYEFYPSRGEVISLAAFYKYFDSPIEWTYTVTGGTGLVYSYKNAQNANTYGLELDVRKDLSFIGLPGLSWSFNGALIKSKVKFESGSREENRPMQGQSPYLINTGLFYKNEKAALDVALLYNRIGKRIIGVGRNDGSTSGQETLRVPDSYEMPRDVFDFSASKRFGSHFELKVSVRDILAQRVYYKQFAEVDYADGSHRTVEQITRSFKPGRNFGLSAVYRF